MYATETVIVDRQTDRQTDARGKVGGDQIVYNNDDVARERVSRRRRVCRRPRQTAGDEETVAALCGGNEWCKTNNNNRIRSVKLGFFNFKIRPQQRCARKRYFIIFLHARSNISSAGNPKTNEKNGGSHPARTVRRPNGSWNGRADENIQHLTGSHFCFFEEPNNSFSPKQ